MLRRSINNKREKQLFIKRFYPAGTYTWTVPAGCEEDQSSDHWNEKLCTFSSSGDTLYFTIDNNTGETWASGSYGAYAVPNETGLHTAYVDVILKNIRNY